MARGDPNIQGSYSGGLPSGGYRQPNVQPYMGNILAARYGGGGYGGAGGFGQTDPRKKRLQEMLGSAVGAVYPQATDPAAAATPTAGGSGAARKPFGRTVLEPTPDPIKDQTLAGLDQTGPGGEVYDPERLFNIRGRDSTPYNRMQGISAAADKYRGLNRNPGGVARGFGFGNPDDLFRKLIMQRLGGGF